MAYTDKISAVSKMIDTALSDSNISETPEKQERSEIL